MDDESYFTLNNSTLPGNDRFYTDNDKACPEEVKYNLKPKFEQKLLVWIAVSSEGMSRPWFVPSQMAICAASCYFKAMFSCDLKESRLGKVFIENISPWTNNEYLTLFTQVSDRTLF